MYISIAFVLLDGGTYHLCGNPTDEQITKIMQLCYLHNPNILMGDTPQNREMHKINVKKYKSGQIVIPKVSLETTGAENEEAEQIADAVFSKKEYKGKVLPVPWEYTPEGNKYIVGKNLKCMGLFFAIGFLVMMLLTERVMFNPSNKTYETISGEKRTELLTDGYKEARIEGQYLRRFFHRNFDAADWINRTVYVFADETAVDGYFGIAAVGDWKYYCGEDWSGFAIFYKGEATSMMLDVEDGYYEVPIIDGMDICGVYGIPTEASLMEEQMTKWVIYTMFGLFAFIGFLMFVIGYSMDKKYKKLK